MHGMIARRDEKGRPEAAFCFGTCYLQQLPLSQQAGSPQHMLTVAAEADRDKSITAANANDRTLIFIKSPFGFQCEELHDHS
jgi:hypothetical protein